MAFLSAARIYTTYGDTTEEPMPNYRGNERQDLMIPVCLYDQLVPGTIEHAINWIVDHEIDTSVGEFTHQVHRLG